ncbi:non-homologous end joining protein Ku [Oerskovia jenensis]|uniref:non-homologous end joining protein Ku n=1 Tax=Oerskovia jenensis TaxID=162169 RepID=UPI0036DEBA8E
MRAIWKGAITFGLVNVPIKVYSATEDHDVPLHQVHDKDGGRIRYQRRCEVCGEVVAYEHIDKAYDDGERTVVLTAEDLGSLPAERSREVEVVEFVPTDQIDPMLLDRSYYLEPDSSSNKAYVLLRRTLEETDRTAIVKFALRQRTRLAALRVRDDVLVLQTLLWADEVREAAFPTLDEPAKVSTKELAMSSQLVESFAADFTPEDYQDDYQAQLRQLIEAKIEKGEALDTAETFGEQEEKTDEGAEVIDLMEALRRSVESSRGKKSGDATGEGAAKEAASSGSTKSAAATKKSKGTTASRASGGKAASTKAAASTKEPAKKTTRKKASA